MIAGAVAVGVATFLVPELLAPAATAAALGII